MLTTEGKQHIKRYLAGYVPAIAKSVSFGTGARAEAVGDTALQMEVAQSPINLTNYDFTTNKLVYKASIPDDYVGKIYEVGIYSLEQDPANIEFSSRLLSTFDSASEEWVIDATQAPAVFTASNARVGADALYFNPALSTSVTYALKNLELDLSGYSANDLFKFAYNVENAFVSTFRIRMLTDAANYYDFNLGAQTAGYKFTERAKSSATVVGNPSWTNITQIQVTVTSTAGGAAGLAFDTMRIEDTDSASLDYILVARKVLATPVTKIEGQAQDIEFSLDVTL